MPTGVYKRKSRKAKTELSKEPVRPSTVKVKRRYKKRGAKAKRLKGSTASLKVVTLDDLIDKLQALAAILR